MFQEPSAATRAYFRHMNLVRETYHDLTLYNWRVDASYEEAVIDMLLETNMGDIYCLGKDIEEGGWRKRAANGKCISAASVERMVKEGLLKKTTTKGGYKVVKYVRAI